MPHSHNGVRSRRKDRSRSRSEQSGRSRSRSRSQSKYRSEKNLKSDKRQRRSGWDAGAEQTLETDVASMTSFSGGIGFSASGAPALQQGGSLVATSVASSQGAVQSNSLAIAYHKRAMCRIYVGSLDYYLTVEEIKRVFQAFGVIVAVDMPKEGDRSKGFCFVEFATPESADMALSTMQGFTLKGRSIKVGRPSAVGIPLPPSINPAVAVTDTNALISPTVSGTAMNPSQAGALAAAAVLSSRANYNVDINAILQKTGNPSGAASVPVALSPVAPPAAPMDPNTSSASRIYVGNVPLSFTSADLEKIFSVFGKILSCYLLPNNEVPGTHRGYGFIDFAEPEQAKLSIETMNGFQVVDKNLKVNYASSMRQPSPVVPGLPIPATRPVMPAFMNQNALPNDSVEPPQLASSATGANRVPLGTDGGQSMHPMTLQPSPYNGGGTFLPPQSGSMQPDGFTGNLTAPYPPYMNYNAQSNNTYNTPTMVSDVIRLKNMVSPSEVDQELKLEIQEECSNYGSVKDVVISIVGNEALIFVVFATAAEALRAVPQLHNRWFGGKQIICHLYSKEAFTAGNYTANPQG